MSVVRPVILSGGSGTRLWPLSTPAHPKQFVDSVSGGGSLFGATLARLDGLSDVAPPMVVAGADHLHLIEETSGETSVDLGVIIVEPEGRNTAPAIAAAALYADADEILVILPSDHMISDVSGFQKHVLEAVALAEQGHIVTFGITPRRGDPGYGYLEVGEAVDGARRLLSFKEKPDAVEAEKLAASGSYLWNSGMFVARAGDLVAEMTASRPEVIGPVKESMSVTDDDALLLGPSFADAERISFDHAVMEQTKRGVVIPINVGWDDIGSYLALFETARRDGDDNVIVGSVVTRDVSGSYIHARSRVVAVAGLRNVAVVETEDAVLVLPLSLSQQVGQLAEEASDL